MNKYLTDDWRDCWRWFSMHAMAMALALQVAWFELPDGMREALPAWVAHAVTIALLVLGMVGRLMRQAPGASRGTTE